MILRTYTRVDSGVAVIEYDGRIVLGESLDVLRNSISEALTRGFTKILLDLEGVFYIDSAGLGELVRCGADARRQGATVKLVHLQKKVQGLLQITKLITMFETFDNEDVAVQSFKGDGTGGA